MSKCNYTAESYVCMYVQRVWPYANATHNYGLWLLIITLLLWASGPVSVVFGQVFLFPSDVCPLCQVSCASDCVLICEMQMKVKVNLLDFHVEILASRKLRVGSQRGGDELHLRLVAFRVSGQVPGHVSVFKEARQSGSRSQVADDVSKSLYCVVKHTFGRLRNGCSINLKVSVFYLLL